MALLGGIGDAVTGVTSGVMSLIPGFNTSQQAQSQYSEQMQGLIDRINNEWQLPTYDKTPFTPEEYQLLQTYQPQIAQYVQQQQPELLRNVQGAGAQAQQKALGELSTLADTGVDQGTKAAFESANISADQALRSRRANAISDLANRGLLSSGAVMGADIGAALGASEQQRQASLQAAQDAANRKTQAIAQLGNLGGQVQQQDMNIQQANANTMNNYNTLLTNRRQQYNEYAANTGNQAQMYNQQNAQNIANQNVGLKNQAQMYNQQMKNQLASQQANNANAKLQTIGGMQTGFSGQQLQAGTQLGQQQTGAFLGALGLGLGGYNAFKSPGTSAATGGAASAASGAAPGALSAGDPESLASMA